MMAPPRVWLLAALTLAAGCAPLNLDKGGKSPLAPAQMSPDSVVLDIFFVRCPLAEKALNADLWSDVDEQRFPNDLRRELADNGFRVGLAGPQIPRNLERLLKLEAGVAAPGDQPREVDEPSNVRRRHLQLRSGKRSEIIASGVYDQLPKLVHEGGELHGRTYARGQGILAVKAFPQPDGKARLELSPELHHGEPRQQWVAGDEWVAGDAVWQLDTGRPREVLEALRLNVTLAPGQMLIVTSRPDRPGSLGHYFFTEPSGGTTQQKLLVVRLSQTQRDELFDPDLPATIEGDGTAAKPAAPQH